MQNRKLSETDCGCSQNLGFMKYGAFIFLVLIQMVGCGNKNAIKEEDSSGSQLVEETTHSPSTLDLNEFERLLSQKYIDPLTDYISNHRNEPPKLKYVQRLKLEKQKRCEKIRRLFQKKDRENRVLVRLERGYRYSCPIVVKEFAEQVKATAKKAIDDM